MFSSFFLFFFSFIFLFISSSFSEDTRHKYLTRLYSLNLASKTWLIIMMSGLLFVDDFQENLIYSLNKIEKNKYIEIFCSIYFLFLKKEKKKLFCYFFRGCWIVKYVFSWIGTIIRLHLTFFVNCTAITWICREKKGCKK